MNCLTTEVPAAAGSVPTPVWKAKVLTAFPELFPGPLASSLVGKALAGAIWNLETFDLRDFGEGRHRKIDDRPTGGGPGMILMPEVVAAALEKAATGTPTDRQAWPLLHLTPRGKRFRQDDAARLARAEGVTLLCGRFEGIDERAIEEFGFAEVSIGDFVLSGGEIAAHALIDATVRLIPRVLGNRASVLEESFSNGLLEYPQYTRPRVWKGRAVPEVLLSGDHGRIASWRRSEAERATRMRRPDIWEAHREKCDGDPSTGQDDRARIGQDELGD